eukprot:1248470-Pleurochrysis_carterae.AAC.1
MPPLSTLGIARVAAISGVARMWGGTVQLTPEDAARPFSNRVRRFSDFRMASVQPSTPDARQPPLSPASPCSDLAAGVARARFLLYNREYLGEIGAVTCSYFDANARASPEICEYGWPDASAQQACCACGGGTRTQPSPPAPPLHPSPP